MDQSLYFEQKGDSANPPIIFFHGLLGSSRNWRSVCKDLENDFCTITFDLPNHGRSFQEAESSVMSMCECVIKKIDQIGLANFFVCGHSLGGKVAMKMACNHSDRINKLLVVDIAPRNYPSDHHLPTLKALADLNLTGFDSRKEIDNALAEKIPNWAFRQFLLTNLEKVNGQFTWIANLDGLIHSINSLSSNPLSQSDLFNGPSLFLRGGKSGYVRGEHFDEIKRHFPKSEITTLEEAGHDLHVEDRKRFISISQDFFKA